MAYAGACKALYPGSIPGAASMAVAALVLNGVWFLLAFGRRSPVHSQPSLDGRARIGRFVPGLGRP